MAKKFELKTKLTVDDKLSPGLKRAQRQAKRIMSSIVGASARATKSLVRMGTVGVAAAAAGVTKITLDYAAYADELNKFSKAAGLSVEATQELDFAADHLGVSQDTLRKGIEKLEKRIGLARVGTGAMITTMRKASPALLEALKGAENTSDAFDLMIGAIDKMPDAAAKIAIADAAFGLSGPKLVRMAEEGVKGLRSYRREAHKYNLVTGEQADQASDFVDAMTDTKKALGGVSRAIGSNILPAMKPYLEKLEEWLVLNDEIIGQAVGDVVVRFAEAIQDVDFGNVTTSLGHLATVVLAVGDAIGHLSNMGQIIQQAQFDAAGFLERLDLANEDINDSIARRVSAEARHARQAMESLGQRTISTLGLSTFGESMSLRARHRAEEASAASEAANFASTRAAVGRARASSRAIELQRGAGNIAEVTVRVLSDGPAVRTEAPKAKGGVNLNVKTGRRFGGSP
jgi:hypothetical protein